VRARPRLSCRVPVISRGDAHSLNDGEVFVGADGVHVVLSRSCPDVLLDGEVEVRQFGNACGSGLVGGEEADEVLQRMFLSVEVSTEMTRVIVSASKS